MMNTPCSVERRDRRSQCSAPKVSKICRSEAQRGQPEQSNYTKCDNMMDGNIGEPVELVDGQAEQINYPKRDNNYAGW